MGTITPPTWGRTSCGPTSRIVTSASALLCDDSHNTRSRLDLRKTPADHDLAGLAQSHDGRSPRRRRHHASSPVDRGHARGAGRLVHFPLSVALPFLRRTVAPGVAPATIVNPISWRGEQVAHLWMTAQPRPHKRAGWDDAQPLGSRVGKRRRGQCVRYPVPATGFGDARVPKIDGLGIRSGIDQLPLAVSQSDDEAVLVRAVLDGHAPRGSEWIMQSRA